MGNHYPTGCIFVLSGADLGSPDQVYYLAYSGLLRSGGNSIEQALQRITSSILSALANGETVQIGEAEDLT